MKFLKFKNNSIKIQIPSFSFNLSLNNHKDITFKELFLQEKKYKKKTKYLYMNNNAGFANQIRCLLSIKSFGFKPVIDYSVHKKAVKRNFHYIDILNFFKIELVKKKTIKKKYFYNSICIPTDSKQRNFKEIFNLINFSGTVDASYLVKYKYQLTYLRKMYDELNPLFKSHELNKYFNSDIDMGISLRDFTVENLKFYPREFRFIYKNVEFNDEFYSILNQEVSFLKKKYNIKNTIICTKNNFNPKILDSIEYILKKNSIKIIKPLNKTNEIIDFTALMNCKFLIYSKYSTFGHLASLLNKDILYVKNI